MKISVVTVCYNSEKTIRQTIESVINQTYRDIEYLIIDGKSEDRTWSIINEYSDDERIIALSEKDDGLYDAMNKATDLSTGDYIIFLNSGDFFVDKNVLANIIPKVRGDITYGNVIRIRENGEYVERYGNRTYVKILLLFGKMVCHQTMFIKTNIMKKYKYDLRYNITADFNFLCRCVKDKRKLFYVNQNVAYMDNRTGISSTLSNIPIMWNEDDESLNSCFPILFRLVYPLKRFKRLIS